MEYLEAKATTTPTTDLGEFRALVATYDRDRTGDEIKSGAFARSISEWRDVGRRVPLHWNHEADQIIGDIDPEEMWEDDAGLQVSGRVDLDDEQGRKVWKSLKRNRIGFSFGYVTTRSEKRSDGGLNLLELDVYEISATPSPMNNRTRILSTKSATAIESLSDAELRERSLGLVEQALAPEPPPEEAMLPTREELDEEKNALVERSRAEYQTARAAEAAAQHKKEQLEWQMYNAPRPPTRLELQPNGTYKEVDARDPGDISPGLGANAHPLPTPNERKAAQERDRLRQDAEKREEAEHKAALEADRRRHQEALHRRAAEEGYVVVNGVRMLRNGEVLE